MEEIEAKGPKKDQQNSVEIDLLAYMSLLEDVEITDDEKLELLSSLYAIIKSFIDLGFSIENAGEACGEIPDKTGAALLNHVYSSHQSHIAENTPATLKKGLAAEEGV